MSLNFCERPDMSFDTYKGIMYYENVRNKTKDTDAPPPPHSLNHELSNINSHLLLLLCNLLKVCGCV